MFIKSLVEYFLGFGDFINKKILINKVITTLIACQFIFKNFHNILTGLKSDDTIMLNKINSLLIVQ